MHSKNRIFRLASHATAENICSGSEESTAYTASEIEAAIILSEDKFGHGQLKFSRNVTSGGEKHFPSPRKEVV